METLRKFEGASLDELLAFVHRECGESAQIVEANRVRRGGVGGFFAKEAFEVVVAPGTDDEEPTAGDAGGDRGGAQAGSDRGEPPRPWMRSTTEPAPGTRAAAVARALDDAGGDELVGDVAAALGGVRSVAAGADRALEIEQAIAREAAATMRADRTALIPPHLRTPVAPIKAGATDTPSDTPTGATSPADALLGLVHEANGADRREPVTFAAALEQALAQPEPVRTPRAADTMSLDDLLDLELPRIDEPVRTPVPTAQPAADPMARLAEDFIRQAERPAGAGDPATMLAEDFIRAADARYRDGAAPGPVDARAAAMADRLIAQASSAGTNPPTISFTTVDTVDTPGTDDDADEHQANLAYLAGLAATLTAEPVAPAERVEPVAPAEPVEPVVPVAVEPTPVENAPSQPVTAPAPVALPSVAELVTRYEQVPVAPPLPAGPGLILVIGDGEIAHTSAVGLAGPGGRAALASQEPPASVPSWATIRTTDEVLDRVERTRRTDERLVLAVELGTTPAGILWAKRLIDRLPARQVRMAVSSGAALDDVQAAIELLGRVDAIDLVRPPHTTAPVDVEQVLGLGTPVATVDGHPTSPALWAALTLEGATRV